MVNINNAIINLAFMLVLFIQSLISCVEDKNTFQYFTSVIILSHRAVTFFIQRVNYFEKTTIHRHSDEPEV